MDMNTPICDFVNEYISSGKTRLHMPGHKGLCPECATINDINKFDITEIYGADVLYHSSGIIKESENNAATLYGTARTVYSCEGSSLSIRAMMYLIKSKYGKLKVLATRNAHSTFITACALLDIEIEWVYGENLISVTDIEESVIESSNAQAVYITSPDYLGNIADIEKIAHICHKHNKLLVVDNAHGAYLKFLNNDLHPISLGADMCVDSAHKTLPVLTGGGYLHISKNADAQFSGNAENAMRLFASTSPSYIIMQSLDMTNKYLSAGYKEKLNNFIIELDKLKANITIDQTGTEPLKLTLMPKSYGYTGDEIYDILFKNGFVCEFSDPDFVVMMFTPEIPVSELERLYKVINSIEKRAPIVSKAPLVQIHSQTMPVRQAVLAQSEEVNIENAVGRICSTPSVACPPAIPIVMCGETITEYDKEIFNYYSIDKCRVVKV